MNLFLAILLLILSIILASKRASRKILISIISFLSQQSFALVNIIIGICLLAFVLIRPSWYFYSQYLILFLLGLIFLIHGLFVFRSDENVYLAMIKKVQKNYYIYSISVIFALLMISVLLIFRSYIGPFSEVNNCNSGDNLSIVCGLEKSPEDIVITPDNKYLIISGFGGISPLHESNDPRGGEGSLFLMDAYTKANNSLNIRYEDNVWGDGVCDRDSESSFNPHGIDLVKRDDGKYQLVVVNHLPFETIEMFELLKTDIESSNEEIVPIWELVWRGCVSVPEEYYLNDVSLAPDGSLFTTHMHSKTISILEFLFKSITKGKTGFAMRWDKEFGFSEISNSQGGQPNGIVYDNSTDILHISLNLSDKIISIDLRENKIINTFSLNSPDNLVFDGQNLWVTNFEHEILDPLRCVDSVCPLPFRVTKLDAKSYKVLESWFFAGEPFGLPSVAVPISNELISGQIVLGSFMSDRLAYFNADIK